MRLEETKLFTMSSGAFLSCRELNELQQELEQLSHEWAHYAYGKQLDLAGPSAMSLEMQAAFVKIKFAALLNRVHGHRNDCSRCRASEAKSA